MRVVLFAIGMRGDVQPYVALGLGLKATGHQVVVATHEPFRASGSEHGPTFRPITGNVQVISKRTDWSRWMTNVCCRKMSVWTFVLHLSRYQKGRGAHANPLDDTCPKT